jgi:hypothetical protein
MGKSSGSIWVSLGLRTANFSKGISKAKKDLNGFQKFGQGLKGMFNPMTVGIGVVAGLGAALTNAVGIFNDFEKANSALKAVLKGTDAEMESLSDQAKLLGSTSAFTANEVSSLQKELAKLGFNSTQIENMTEATLNLAAAAGVELSEAAAFAGASLNAFGLNSTNAGHITDVMAASFASSALDMEKLSETMKTAAPIARATGVSFEVATAAAGKLADANISGSKAGTDLKNIFSELVKDGKPFQESLEDIATKLNGASTKAEKLAIAEKLVGERAKGSLLILVDQKEALGLLATEFENADGTAKEMADTMLDNVAGSMTKAGSAYEGFILSIEDGNGIISKAMKGLIDGFTDALSLLTEFNSSDLSIFERIASLTTPAVRKVIKLRDANKEVKESVEDIVEVMPDLEKGVENAIKEVVTLTAAQEKAAIAARNFGSVLQDSLSIKALPTGLSSAIDNILNDIAEEGNKPRKLHISVQPELVVQNPEESGAVINGDMIKLGESAGAALSSSLVGAATEGLVGLGEALGSGGGAEDFGNALLGGFSGLLSSFGEQMITLGLGMIALKAALALGPLGAGLAIAGGVALIAVASSIKGTMDTASAEGFAAGGLVTGSVFANIGEGRGTTRSNPEVIAPLDKLKGFMPDAGGMGGDVEFVIKGNNLVGVLKKTGKRSSFSN